MVRDFCQMRSMRPCRTRQSGGKLAVSDKHYEHIIVEPANVKTGHFPDFQMALPIRTR
jgi:hypothetical protein